MAVVRTLACLAGLALAATETSLAAPKSPDAAMMAPINAVAAGLNGGKTLTGGPFSGEAPGRGQRG